jgi:hypothetical protein
MNETTVAGPSAVVETMVDEMAVKESRKPALVALRKCPAALRGVAESRPDSC